MTFVVGGWCLRCLNYVGLVDFKITTLSFGIPLPLREVTIHVKLKT
jgi:hypothetical protein